MLAQTPEGPALFLAEDALACGTHDAPLWSLRLRPAQLLTSDQEVPVALSAGFISPCAELLGFAEAALDDR